MRLRPWLWPLAIFAVALVSLLVGLAVVDVQGEAAIARQQERIASAARDYFVDFARVEGQPALARALDRHAAADAPDGLRYGLVAADGRMLGGADVISSLDLPEGAGAATVVEPDTRPRHRWRVLREPLPDGASLIVAEDLAVRDDLRDAILRGSLWALALTAAGAAAGGVALNAVMLRRTGEIARAADRIAHGDLAARAPEHPGGDLFDRLGGSINAMLARIDQLMTGLRAATDAVAHDLRSPLTRLKNALDQVADAPDRPARTRALDRAYGELDRASATLNALLDIARAESGLSRDMMRPVDLVSLAGQMVELFGPAAEDAGQVLRLEAPLVPVRVCAHEALLRQAIGNLLHNAVVHAGPGADISLAVEETPSGARLVVADTGPGVPAAELGRVQERFVRLDAARTSAGSGLGLALAAACAKLHGSVLDLADNHPGLRAALEFPTA
jgi:signal transduction histidine kinase